MAVPRILIVNVHWLGDVLFSTPAIRALRKHFKEAYLACLVPSRCAEALRNNPYLNEVLTYQDHRSIAAIPTFAEIILRLRQRRFDTAIFFHRSKTKVFLSWLAGIEERVGFSAPGRDRLLTRVCEDPPEKIHRIDYFLDLLQKTGVPSDGRTLDFFPDKADELSVEALWRSHGIEKDSPYIVVHAGGNWALKRWPASYFARWIRLFLDRFGWRVILCGTKAEETLSREIEAHFKAGEVISICGQTSLGTLAVILKKAKFVLSNDSGPIHLAASQKTRILGLFGPTSPKLTGPVSDNPMIIFQKDVGCEVPCYFRSCNYRVCMEWLTPEEVFQRTVELLNCLPVRQAG